MKRMQIADRELIAALRRMAPETGSLLCLGCGYERNCSIHGCTVLRAAVERLKELTAPVGPSNPVKDCKAILSALRPPEADPRPLTLDELREMDGEPVYIQGDIFDGYYVAYGDKDGVYVFSKKCHYLSFFANKIVWTAYRRKPEEGTEK